MVRRIKMSDNHPLAQMRTAQRIHGSRVKETSVMAISWAIETMCKINDLTPDIKGKAFDPDWFLLRQRLEEAERKLAEFGQEWDGEKFVFNGLPL
jgi:hypothetical protein